MGSPPVPSLVGRYHTTVTGKLCLYCGARPQLCCDTARSVPALTVSRRGSRETSGFQLEVIERT